MGDPPRTSSPNVADLHSAIHPGTGVMLFDGSWHTMLREGWPDSGYAAAYTVGFEAL